MWNRNDFNERVRPAAIGMIHLQALPGAPGWGGDLAAVQAAAEQDADALVGAGFGALMVENYHDVPFYPDRVPAVTVAALAVMVAALRRRHPQAALGVNVLRNDVESALSIAAATGAAFVRVNVHVGAAVTDQGTLQGQAWRTLRLRRELGLETAIFADVRVKHARPLVDRPLAEEGCDLRLRGLADAVIVTGAATGSGADPGEVAQLRAALPDCPLLVGSGVKAESVAGFLPAADGVIVGTSLQTTCPETGRRRVDPARAAAFLDSLRAAASAKGPSV